MIAAERHTRIVDEAGVSILEELCFRATSSQDTLARPNSHVNALAAELGEDGVDVVTVGHVRLDDGNRLTARLLARSLDLSEAITAARNEDEVGTALGEQHGRGRADPTGRARDKHCRPSDMKQQ